MPNRTIADRSIELSSLDKVLWPDDGITKGDLIDHYERFAELLLEHVGGRPLTLFRCPDGIEAECWFHKDAGGTVPDWVTTTRLEGWEQNDVEHVVADGPATLVELGQLAAIELHASPCPADDLDHPAELILDLDPPGGGDPAAVRRAARQLRELLEGDLGLTTFVKTSGSKGFHVHVPLAGDEDVDEVRGFAREVATVLAERHPDELTVEQRKNRRAERIFVDWLRNHPTQTAVAAYSVRARPGAPVATPLGWDELSQGITPDRYTISSVRRRLAQREDPWKGMPAAAQSLDGARERLAG